MDQSFFVMNLENSSDQTEKEEIELKRINSVSVNDVDCDSHAATKPPYHRLVRRTTTTTIVEEFLVNSSEHPDLTSV